MKKLTILILFMNFTLLMASGRTIYVHKCISCHGTNGTKHPLDTLATIKGQNVSTTIKQLKGYRSGILNVYGMGGLMRGQVKHLSDKDIVSVAKYISKF